MCVSGCMTCYWLQTGMAADSGTDVREQQLDTIRRHMSFADIGKVAPEDMAPNLMLPAIVNPKDRKKKIDLIGSSNKKVSLLSTLLEQSLMHALCCAGKECCLVER